MASRTTPSWGRVAGMVVAAAGVLFAPASASADVDEPIALHYDADASSACPSESEFVSLVRAHTSRWTRVPEGTSASRTMRIVVSADRGKLVVANPSGVVSERELAGPSCRAVSRALALMVAVAIDPLAGLAGETNEGPPSNGAHTDAPRNGAPRAERPPATSDRAPAPAPKPAGPAGRAGPRGPRGPRVSLEVRAETTSAVVRGVLLGAGLSVKLELPPDVGPEWLRAWQPSVGIGLRQSLPKELVLRGGSAEFTWTAGHLRLCPFRLSFAGIVAASPCAEVNLGRLNAAATGFAEARAASTFWCDAGASLWTTVSVSGRVFLSSTLLVTAPNTRQPFALASGTLVSEPPAVGVLGGIGIGVTM